MQGNSRKHAREAGKSKDFTGRGNLPVEGKSGKLGYAGRTTRRWISPSSLKSRMVATARM